MGRDSPADTLPVQEELDRVVADGTRIAGELRRLAGVPVDEPTDGPAAQLVREAHDWMVREDALRERRHLKLGLREMEHFDEAAYLASEVAPEPDWRRLLVLRLEYRVSRLRKVR